MYFCVRQLKREKRDYIPIHLCEYERKMNPTQQICRAAYSWIWDYHKTTHLLQYKSAGQ
jgi:hypothetical protein